jgi:hypothetical protein
MDKRTQDMSSYTLERLLEPWKHPVCEISQPNYKHTTLFICQEVKRKAYIKTKRQISLLSLDSLDYDSRSVDGGSDETTDTSGNKVVEQLCLLRLTQAMNKNTTVNC